METITSRENAKIKYACAVRDSEKQRAADGLFFAEGPKLCLELAKSCTPRAMYATAAALAKTPELAQFDPAEIAPHVAEKLSGTKSNQGVFALFETPVPPADTLDTARRILMLEGVQDPGNVGTILRTADAFHADGMFLVNGCADLYNPKTLRATMGAVFRCPVWTVGAEELSALLKKSGIPLYGAALREDTLDARAVDYNRCAIAIGSEGRGLTEGVLALCDRTIKIPMSEHCESLNAAAAATVLLWEAARND
mgnify:CR=1 FL=1